VAIAPQNKVLPPVDADRLDALQLAVAEYDREQLLWSSGFLAGMAAVRTAPEQAAAVQQVAVASTWVVFYATETGNSRRVAESLAERARESGLVVNLHDLRDYRPKALAKVDNALFVIATHGIGEAPDGSEMFFEYWLSDRAPRLDHLNFSILALGDSSYADFCEMGRVLDERLRDLGANAVVDRVDCDLDFDSPAAEWSETVVDHARDVTDVGAPRATSYLRAVSTTPFISRDNPFDAEILINQKITGSGSSKDVRHIELSLEGSGLQYLPGDSLGVIPQNPSELVESLLENLRLDGALEVAIDGKTLVLSEALTKHREITVLNRPFLETVAAEDEKLRSIVEDRDRLADFLKSRQIIDVIADYPKIWHAQEFVGSLRKLTPRLYSIASGADTNPEEAHLTVALVRYEQFGRLHWGAASNCLTSGAPHVPVYIEPNDYFRLPADGDVPIIMIGAGTGIAPYRSFVEHRREHGQRGDNWLLFGDRNLSTDFLYQLEWLRYRKDGTLKRLDVAFSRDQRNKIYVQDRILEQAQRVYSWLERGAHIYVCGDADHMAVDVNNALLTVLQNVGGMSGERATEYLSELKSARRYQRDVY
jgi:sulfite reductase (NADPH) flavoprotein alpha-component